MTIEGQKAFFVTDLHGDLRKYELLFRKIREDRPGAVFIGGDLLPSPLTCLTKTDFFHEDFINGFLAAELKKVRTDLGKHYPEIFIILGNDDGRMEEAAILDISVGGIWNYIHNRRIFWNNYSVFGYSYIPPSPFRLKDWERYDVSRYVDPGCTAPSEGSLSIPVKEYDLNFRTIRDDLEDLSMGRDLKNSIFLFHAPPYQTVLDKADLGGRMIDHVPLDEHIGSIAIKNFILENSPWITLHGHVHESTRLTGSWSEKLGTTTAFNAAHDGPELSLIEFDPAQPDDAVRTLLK